MKKEKADLEQLLNSLIEKGWKPRWYENCIRLNADWWYIPYMEDENRSIEIDKSIRDLTAKESNLWQFVCENCLVKNTENCWSWNNNKDGRGYEWRYAPYRLIESSLKDESELEDFLLNSIKID